MPELLAVKNLCKEGILKNISFTVNAGEMVAVMGPSGSGKSTLLYQVSGNEPTGALNQSAAQEVMEEFICLNREGTTILIVTHDSRVAARCSRILYLLDGSIKRNLSLVGTPEGKCREEKVNRWLVGLGW